MLPNHWGNVPVYTDGFEGDVFIEASLRSPENNDYCIPHTVISLKKHISSVVPCINLSDRDINLKKGTIFVRAWPCIEEEVPEKVMSINVGEAPQLPLEDVEIGPIDEERKLQLFDLLNEFRDCFALDTSELGCARSATMTITLNNDKPFTIDHIECQNRNKT